MKKDCETTDAQLNQLKVVSHNDPSEKPVEEERR